MRNKNAFTLVEVLLSAMILSIVAGAVYRVFAVAVKTHERVDQRLKSSLKVLSALERLEEDTGNIILSSSVSSFTGDAESLSMLVGNGMDAAIVRYKHHEGGLVRSQTRAGKEFNEMIFAQGDLKQSAFSFGYLSEDSGRVIWREIWDTDGLPFAVRWTAQISAGSVNALPIERTVFIPHGEWGRAI
jgi:prepilin-type N-terminal cleavage/methylation domain-containing protein